ncbi:MAG: hypothetical protein Q9207_002724 [Kuettlingeria erythrocarpa]
MRPKHFKIHHITHRLSFLYLSLIILALAFLANTTNRLNLLLRHLPISFSSLPKAYQSPLSTYHPPTMSTYTHELTTALLAVQRATLLTQRVFHNNAKGTLSKDDHSPVTVGDFGAQALIIAALRHNFPEDEIVGEEEASSLREKKSLAEQIYALVKESRLDDEEAEERLGGPVRDEEAMLAAIDAGSSAGGDKGRIWALDPVDGTKGFLRGGQYAVCLALIVDGDVKVGVLGCPNLPVDDAAPLSADVGGEGRGVLFAAVQGEGATSRPLTHGALAEGKKISMREVEDITQATFCESVEAAHSSHGDQAEIAKRLGITKESVRMDSQAKYGSIARGAGDLYLRLPVRKDYEEKIWDHAAGDLIVREAGGEVTDAERKRLDFGVGRTLKRNKGVVAAPKGVHGTVLKVVKEVLGNA